VPRKIDTATSASARPCRKNPGKHGAYRNIQVATGESTTSNPPPQGFRHRVASFAGLPSGQRSRRRSWPITSATRFSATAGSLENTNPYGNNYAPIRAHQNSSACNESNLPLRLMKKIIQRGACSIRVGLKRTSPRRKPHRRMPFKHLTSVFESHQNIRQSAIASRPVVVSRTMM